MENYVPYFLYLFLFLVSLGMVSAFSYPFCSTLCDILVIGVLSLLIFSMLKKHSVINIKRVSTIAIISIAPVLFQILLFLNFPDHYPGISILIKPFYFTIAIQIAESILFVSVLANSKNKTSRWVTYLLYTSFFLASLCIIYLGINGNSPLRFPLFAFVLALISIPILFILRKSFHGYQLLISLFCFVNFTYLFSTISKPVSSKQYSISSYLLKTISWILLYRLIIVAPHAEVFSKIPVNTHPHKVEIEPGSDLLPCIQCSDNLQIALTEIHSEHQSSPLLNLIIKNAVLLTGANGGELGIFDTKKLIFTSSAHFAHTPFSVENFFDYKTIMNTVAITRKVIVTSISVTSEKDQNCFVLAVPLLNSNNFHGVIIVTNINSNFSNINRVHLNLLASQAALAINNTHQLENTLRQAQTDSLTGLYNHRHLFELAKKEISRAQRYKHPLTAMMIDIDHFKNVNDTYGHPAGDQVLVTVANLCRKLFRNIDIIGRYGGEEFAILLPETPMETASEVAERLRHTIEKTTTSYHRRRISVTISLGIASLRSDCTSIGRLIERADTALYHSKTDGRNRITIWKASMCYIGHMKHPKALAKGSGKSIT